MLKLFFDTEGCVFVVGFDPSILSSILEHDYGKDIVGDGLTYLKKLIQLNYRLPQPANERLHKFIDITLLTAV